MKRAAAIITVLCLMSSAALADDIKILAIGNSFTRNALKYFYAMAEASGVEGLTVANMHISGCSLKKHFKQISKDKKSYEYYYQDESGETVRKKVRMSEVISSQDWDYIILQQTGGHSGVVGLYTPYLKYMINYVSKNSPNSDFRLVWHGTWAYAGKCRNHSFARYNYSQKRMYNAIVNAESVLIYPNEAFDVIIPVGRAIQAIRNTSIGDKLNVSDGYHLNDTGCYAAALTWVYTLFGISPERVNYAPVDISAGNMALIKQSVSQAVEQYARR
ncbi:MAG: DUF4886 domain-containing protein [Clostridia bacterium]|nr:DUF4886 domain-containing protein [Clostridia bacterium]